MSGRKMESLHGIVRKHGAEDFLDAASYYASHMDYSSVDNTIYEMENRWYDCSHVHKEAEKMLEDYNNGLTILNESGSFACVDMGQAFRL